MSQRGRPDRKKQLIDAAESILIAEGPAAVTTRRVAAQADMNQALVHYHFSSISELMLAVHDRMSEDVRARLSEIYRGDAPLVEKWRRHVGSFFGEDYSRGYPKIWLELSTLAINQPELRARVVPRLEFLRSLFVEAIETEVAKKRLDLAAIPVEALAALALTLTEGMFVEKLLGYERGHADLIAFLDQHLVTAFGAEPAEDGQAAEDGRAGSARRARAAGPIRRRPAPPAPPTARGASDQTF